MKRMIIRIAALTIVVGLSVVAIVQAQRGGKPSSEGETASAGDDATKPDATKPDVKLSPYYLNDGAGYTPPKEGFKLAKEVAASKGNRDEQSGKGKSADDPFAAGRFKSSRKAAGEPARMDTEPSARPLSDRFASDKFASDDPYARRKVQPAKGEDPAALPLSTDDPYQSQTQASPAAADPFLQREAAAEKSTGKFSTTPADTIGANSPSGAQAGSTGYSGSNSKTVQVEVVDEQEPAAADSFSSFMTAATSANDSSKAGTTRTTIQSDKLPPRNDPPAAFNSDTVSPLARPAASSLANNNSAGSALSDTLPSSKAPSTVAPAGAEGTGRPGLKGLEGSQTPQLVIEKVAPPEVQVGKTATFQVKVRNTGSVPASGVEVHDEVPQGTQLVKTTPAASAGARGQIVWSLGTLKPGDETTVQMDVLPLTEGEIGSVATVQFRTDASARTVVTKPALAIAVTSPKQVMIGSDVTLAIKVSNPGTGVASNVVLEEKVPQGLTHPAGPELELEIGELKPGESRQIDLTLSAAAAGKTTNLLVARGENGLKAEERVELQVVAPALEVAMTGPARRYLERQATYTVSVSNPGTAPAKDVHLVTHLPKGLKFIKANNAGTYDAASHSVAWNLEELPAAETGSVSLTALPIEAGEQKLRIDAKAQQGLKDQHEQVILVEGLAAVMFEVADVEDPIEVGGQAAYEIRVVNQGSKTATNIQIVAAAPPEAKPLSAEGPTRHSIDGQRIVFEPLAKLAPKADTTFKVRLQGMKPGDLRFKVQLTSDDVRTPLTKEESTRVFADE